ncbi:MFS transporter [Leucobacter aridicollis]|uniref:MFS transporter n=1 Tax=Leucobacter aridicollis TaxID=283878 RepID=UPI0021688462|nr:MFS transporter [Leucobacter aridicollis]MCS3428139.1 fucose permease [Leucobacter aridicollis]
MRPVTIFRGWSLAGCYAAMLVIGLLMSVYGPIVTVLQGRFELSAAAVGAALGTQSFAAVIGVLLAQPLLRARGNRWTIVLAMALIAVGSLVIAISPTWPLLLAGTAVAGLGFGGVDSLITQLILVGSGAKGPGRANIAHAWFGIGTVAGPGLVFLVGPGNYAWIFAGAAALMVFALLSATRLEPRPTPAEVTTAAHPDDTAPARRPALFGIVIVAFFALYLTHFAVQAGIGNWSPTVLQEQSDLAAPTATLFVTGFWAAMVLGRFAAATLAHRVSAGTLVTISSLGLAVAVAATLLPTAAPWAYVVGGLFLGPIFPTGMAWLTHSGYGRGNSFAYVIAGSMLGMALAPSFVGWIIENQGSQSAPLVLLIIAVLVLASSATLVALIARARRSDASAEPVATHDVVPVES